MSAGPYGIAAGADGALWFTESIGKIGRVTTSGSFSEIRQYQRRTANPGRSRRVFQTAPYRSENIAAIRSAALQLQVRLRSTKVRPARRSRTASRPAPTAHCVPKSAPTRSVESRPTASRRNTIYQQAVRLPTESPRAPTALFGLPREHSRSGESPRPGRLQSFRLPT